MNGSRTFDPLNPPRPAELSMGGRPQRRVIEGKQGKNGRR
tara:strand:- start:570 stop:689 length:120 start_codon:yes stop_codon:yes gene_type:complete